MRLIEKVARIGTLVKSPTLAKSLAVTTKAITGKKVVVGKVAPKIKPEIGATTPSRMR